MHPLRVRAHTLVETWHGEHGLVVSNTTIADVELKHSVGPGDGSFWMCDTFSRVN